MIVRQLENNIQKRLKDNKAIILLGARQVGKTTLLNNLTANRENVLHWNGDDADIREMLANPTSTRLKSYIGKNTTLVIDEAQRIENIGLCLKLIIDNIKGVKVIATGSSAFELANKINEPLTGRKWEYTMYPISFEEMVSHTDLLTEQRLLEQRLVFGYYPDVLNNPGEEKEILKQLANSYLYKDILTWERIQKPDRLEKLVQAIAFQVGNLVSYNELGQMAGLDNQTVEHYINLLEKAFIVFRLNSFSRNLRNELKKSRKIYFYDNGLRNAVINQFNPIGLRADKGALWENFLIVERLKHISYHNFYANRYFWRTSAQQEIDYIEEADGKINAYEFKYAKNTEKVRFPKTFTENYNPEKTTAITLENYTEFIIR
ncbi:MAG: ATP-binding protein [Flavobacteriaceae bacterium]